MFSSRPFLLNIPLLTPTSTDFKGIFYHPYFCECFGLPSNCVCNSLSSYDLICCGDNHWKKSAFCNHPIPSIGCELHLFILPGKQSKLHDHMQCSHMLFFTEKAFTCSWDDLETANWTFYRGYALVYIHIQGNVILLNVHQYVKWTETTTIMFFKENFQLSCSVLQKCMCLLMLLLLLEL